MTALPMPHPSFQGTLELALAPERDEPERPLAPVLPLPRDERGRLEQWAYVYTQAAVEIVGGDRPAPQLIRWTSAYVYRELVRRATHVAEAGRHTTGQGRVQPVRPQVATLHTHLPAPRVAEVSARVRYGERSRALALRFERAPHGWICTALEFA
jgi:hypothetical protein